MVGILIIGVSMVGVVFGFHEGYSILCHMREVSAACRVVEEAMEGVRDTPFDNIQGSQLSPSEMAPLKYNNPSGNITVSYPITGEIDIKKVTVTVSWNSIRGIQLSKSVSTYATKGGVGEQ